MTSTSTLATQIRSLRLHGDAPCPEAIVWLDSLPKATTPQQAWNLCHRADWMLWYAEAVGIDRVTLTRCACACARTALKYAPAGEDRPRLAIEAAERWCDGLATAEEVDAAGAAAGAARTAAGAAIAAAIAAAGATKATKATNATKAAARAAWAAAWAAVWAPRDAGAAAGAAARAAWNAGDAGDAARDAASAAMADLVRGIVPMVSEVR